MCLTVVIAFAINIYEPTQTLPRHSLWSKTAMNSHPFDNDFSLTPEHKKQFRRGRSS